MDVQLRIRTDDQFDDIIYIKDWCSAATEGFAFNHSLPGNNHYHVYLFGLDRHPDAMRRTLGKYLPKQNYAVSKTAGKDKKPIDARIAWQYGTTDKLIEPVWVKTDKQEQYRLSSEAFYKQQQERQERKSKVITEMLVVTEEKLKVDRVWERLMNELIEQPDRYDNKTVAQIKSMISVSYLRNLKAMPRPSDLHRYATSLYYIVKHDLHVNDKAEIPDEALVEEYLR